MSSHLLRLPRSAATRGGASLRTSATPTLGAPRAKSSTFFRRDTLSGSLPGPALSQLGPTSYSVLLPRDPGRRARDQPSCQVGGGSGGDGRSETRRRDLRSARRRSGASIPSLFLTRPRRSGLQRRPSPPIPPSLPSCYSMISVTTPAPTVRPPSRIANRSSGSIAIGVIRSTSICTLSPGITISTPSGRCAAPVTSVVRK